MRVLLLLVALLGCLVLVQGYMAMPYVAQPEESESSEDQSGEEDDENNAEYENESGESEEDSDDEEEEEEDESDSDSSVDRRSMTREQKLAFYKKHCPFVNRTEPMLQLLNSTYLKMLHLPPASADPSEKRFELLLAFVQAGMKIMHGVDMHGHGHGHHHHHHHHHHGHDHNGGHDHHHGHGHHPHHHHGPPARMVYKTGEVVGTILNFAYRDMMMMRMERMKKQYGGQHNMHPSKWNRGHQDQKGGHHARPGSSSGGHHHHHRPGGRNGGEGHRPQVRPFNRHASTAHSSSSRRTGSRQFTRA